MLKKWKNELESLGFVFKKWPKGGTYFVRDRDFIRQHIWGDFFKSEGGMSINLFIEIKDPFRDDPFDEYVVLLNGRLDEDRVVLPSFQRGGKFWTMAEQNRALAALLQYGIPWLEAYSNAKKLIELFEKGLREVFPWEEPESSGLMNKLITKFAEQILFRHGGISNSHSCRPPVDNLYLALLYYHLDNREMSCLHAQEWLKFCREPGRPPAGEPQRTYRQLASMGYHIEGYEAEKPYEQKTKEITPTSDEMAVLVKNDSAKDPIKFLKDLGFPEPEEVLSPIEEECVIVCLCGQWSIVWGPPVLDLLVSSEKDPHRFMAISKKTNLLAFAFESTSGGSGFDWYVNGKRVRSFWKIEGEVYRNEGKPLFDDEAEFINVEEEDGLDLIPLLERLTIPFNVLDECDWRTFRINWE